MEYKIRIKDLPVEERPRERLMKHGVASLSNSELLAIILRTGSRKENVLNLANRILKEFNLLQLSRANVSQLKEIHGISHAKACQIVACFELARRLQAYNGEKKKKIKSSEDAFKLLYPKLSGLKKEKFMALYLNTKNFVIKEEVISIGSLNASIVSPREVFSTALVEGAAGVIVAHNHPSGDTTPSKNDIDITIRLAEAGKLLGVELLDHLIIGDKSYISLRRIGVIE